MLLWGYCSACNRADSPSDALKSVNPDVTLFLLGMFIAGQAPKEKRVRVASPLSAVQAGENSRSSKLMILFEMGLASAFLLNDTLAIIGTPVVLLLSKKHGVPPKLLLLALAFAVTIGSAMSPIGNPQNLLIALNCKCAELIWAPFPLSPDTNSPEHVACLPCF